jgi:hypothetical protein
MDPKSLLMLLLPSLSLLLQVLRTKNTKTTLSWVSEAACVCVSERVRGSVCVSERECVEACVCVSESVCRDKCRCVRVCKIE